MSRLGLWSSSRGVGSTAVPDDSASLSGHTLKFQSVKEILFIILLNLDMFKCQKISVNVI